LKLNGISVLRLVFAALLVLLAAPAGALGPVMGPIPGTPGVPPSGALNFTVRKSGADIGEYAVRFAERDGALVVDIEANIRVRFAFVTVYRYTQRTREIWRDGTLQSLDSDVDDNGTPYKISAAQRDGRLVVDGHTEQLDLAPGALPLSYWNYRLMRESRAFDLQWGSLADIEVAARGPETRAVGGAVVPARRYNMKGFEIKRGERQEKPWLDVDTWYAPDGRLIGMSFHYRGFDFDYVLQ
jgi:hypothetical protein